MGSTRIVLRQVMTVCNFFNWWKVYDGTQLLITSGSGYENYVMYDCTASLGGKLYPGVTIQCVGPFFGFIGNFCKKKFVNIYLR